MTAPEREQGHLDLDVQRSLGAALRAEYGDLVAHLPERFVQLLLPLRKLRGAGSRDAATHETPSPLFADANFDPATISILTESLEEGWDTLQSIGNRTISREALARRLLEIAREGERSPSRLCTTALVSLLARLPD
jgi:hypothetical protein